MCIKKKAFWKELRVSVFSAILGVFGGSLGGIVGSGSVFAFDVDTTELSAYGMRQNTTMDEDNTLHVSRDTSTIAIAFQGRFFDDSYVPLTGSRDLTFEIYGESPDVPIFSTTVSGVQLNNGVVSTHIPNIPADLFDDCLAGATPYQLTVILPAPENSEFVVDILPTPLAAMAFNTGLLNGENSEFYLNASNINAGSLSASFIDPNIVSSINGVSNDGGDIAFIGGANITITPNDSANTITIETSAESGDITAVHAGGGLTGGGVTGDVTLNVTAPSGSGIDVFADSIAVDVTDIAGDGLGELNDTLRVNAGNGIKVTNDAVAVDATDLDGDGLTVSGDQLRVGAGTGISVGSTSVGLASGGVGTTQLANNAVSSSKLKSDSNSITKVSGGTITVSGGAATVNGSYINPNDAGCLTVDGYENQIRLSNSSLIKTAGITFNDGSGAINSQGGITIQRRSINGAFEDNLMTVRLGDGHVGIGTLSPSSRLTVFGDICATGSIGVCSDLRFKRDIDDISNPLDKLMRINGVYFQWRTGEFPEQFSSEERQIGFVAQDLATVLPEAVSKGTDGYYSVDYARVVPLLVEGIKQMDEVAGDKDRRIAELEQELQEITKRIINMEALISSMDNKNIGGER